MVNQITTYILLLSETIGIPEYKYGKPDNRLYTPISETIGIPEYK